LIKAASAVALRKGLWRDKQGFAVPAKRDRKAYFLYAAAGLFSSRRRNPAENAEQGKKGHLWMVTN